jgi:hypothetical protein
MNRDIPEPREETLRRALRDEPGFKGYAYRAEDNLTRLRADDLAAGRRENVRSGWIRRD